MSKHTIKITYGIEDGYAGGTRPHYVTIYLDDLSDCETDEEIENRIDEAVEEHMRETISTYWERDQIAGVLERIQAERDAESAS